MRIFDTHCHLDDAKFDEDREEAYRRMMAAEVKRCVCVGSDIPSSRRCMALAASHPGVYAAAGVHPHEAKDAPPDYLDTIRNMLSQPRVQALGEIGLDYYYDLSPRDVQMRVMAEQVDLAVELGKPVIFHIRDAHGDMVDFFGAGGNCPKASSIVFPAARKSPAST